MQLGNDPSCWNSALTFLMRRPVWWQRVPDRDGYGEARGEFLRHMLGCLGSAEPLSILSAPLGLLCAHWEDNQEQASDCPYTLHNLYVCAVCVCVGGGGRSRVVKGALKAAQSENCYHVSCWVQGRGCSTDEEHEVMPG